MSASSGSFSAEATSKTSNKDQSLEERKLENLVAIIEKLLNARPQPVNSLKEHINQLEKAILFLPKEQHALANAYRDKVTQFWQLFEYGEAAQVVGKDAGTTLPPVFQSYYHSDSFAPASARPNSFFNSGGHRESSDGFKPFVGGDEEADDDEGYYEQGRVTPRPPFRHQSQSGQSPSPEQVRSKLRQAFDRLGKISSIEEDFEGMKELLLLVTKARALTMVHWKNVPLLSEIFRYAYAALPTKQQQIYASNYSDKKMWLKDLRMFIQQEIDLFVSLQFSEGRRGDPKQKAAAKKSLCFYCKQNGHIAENCPILKSTLCVKCFRFGHTDFRCPNEVVFVRLADI